MNPLRISFLLALLFSVGCGGPDEPVTFIALQRDFEGFTTWESFHLEADGTDSIHTGLARDLYLNSRPSKGAKEFPVGTMIVKHTDDTGAPNAEGPRTFAMVKRGGGYNRAGALDWEWFELIQTTPEDPASAWQISWRGLGPPIGSEYGGGGSECNGCHATAESNDYVQSQALQLSTLVR